MPSTHSSRLERWLGKEGVENLSNSMRGYYGPPIPVANVPGRVFACGDGDFCGPIQGGYVSSLYEYACHKIQNAWKRHVKRQQSTLHAGFASLSDLISEATSGGKRQDFVVAKAGGTGVATLANNLMMEGVLPPTMTTLTANNGESPTNTTQGAIKYTNPTGGDTLHFVSATFMSSVGNNCLMMYDLYYRFLHNIAATQAVSDVPSRYQSTEAAGTFMTTFVAGVLSAGTLTHQITYMDQDGNTAEAATANAFRASAIARSFPHAVTVGNGWFIPLNTGDVGVRKITNLTMSNTTMTGTVHVCLCKPYVWIPQPIASQALVIDGINAAFNLVKITDSSCIQFFELCKGATTATNYNGIVTFVAG